MGNKICGIYGYTLDGRMMYIGQSVDINRRDKQHHKALPLSWVECDWRLGGIDGIIKHFDFKLVILEECSRDCLDMREIWWINHFNNELHISTMNFDVRHPNEFDNDENKKLLDEYVHKAHINWKNKQKKIFNKINNIENKVINKVKHDCVKGKVKNNKIKEVKMNLEKALNSVHPEFIDYFLSHKNYFGYRDFKDYWNARKAKVIKKLAR